MRFNRRRLCLMLAVPAILPAQASDEEVWSSFLAWLKTIPPSGNPAGMMQQYRAALSQRGVVAAEADRQLSRIRALMKSRDDGWTVIFNNIYASSQPGFNVQPSALLVASLEGRQPGRALDVGMGQGRNSVFLAMKGWEVTGFDISDEGIAVARRNAAKAGVKLTAIHKGDAEFDYGSAVWDLIVITYEPFPVTEPAYVSKLEKALKPGGILVIESFASDQHSSNRRPVDIDPQVMLRAFSAWRILRFEDATGKPDWDPTPTRLARMVAERR